MAGFCLIAEDSHIIMSIIGRIQSPFSKGEQLDSLRYVDEISGFLYIDLCKELVLNEKLAFRTNS